MATETEDPRIMVRMPAEMAKGLDELGQTWAQQRPATGSRFLHPDGTTKIATVIREIIGERLEGDK